jgi:hypothetical protein
MKKHKKLFSDICKLKLKFPEIKYIKVWHFPNLNKIEKECFANFYKYSFPNKLQKFTLNGGYNRADDKSFIFSQELFDALKSVRNQINIQGYYFDDDDLQKLFESCSNCSILDISHCKIKIKDQFSISSNIEFKIKDLYIDDDTFSFYKFGYDLDISILKRFFTTISCSNMVNSLQTIYITAAKNVNFITIK